MWAGCLPSHPYLCAPPHLLGRVVGGSYPLANELVFQVTESKCKERKRPQTWLLFLWIRGPGFNPWDRLERRLCIRKDASCLNSCLSTQGVSFPQTATCSEHIPLHSQHLGWPWLWPSLPHKGMAGAWGLGGHFRQAPWALEGEREEDEVLRLEYPLTLSCFC